MIDLERAEPDEIVSGYAPDAGGGFSCLLCGEVFAAGEVFRLGGRFYEAERAAQIHVETAHSSRFTDLINTDSKYLSLTPNQKELLTLFQSGLTDGEIAKRLHISPSTVRHQKFMFREKAKAAKLYLAVWEMVEYGKNKQAGQKLLPVHEGAKMVDERYVITQQENDNIIKNMFVSLDPLKLKIFSPKEKKKIVILRKIAEQFERERVYTEKEVNQILGDIHEDFATLRRYLVEYGFMERTSDCRSYWLKRG